MASIRTTLAGLRRRTRLQAAARGATYGAATGGLALACAGAMAGPVVAPAFAWFAWGAVTAAAAAGVVLGLAPLRALAGDRLTSVLEAKVPGLPSRVRTALQLRERTPGSSDALREAHLGAVAAGLARVPAPEVLPWRTVGTPLLGAAGLVACAVLLLTLGYAPLRSGVSSLARPASPLADGSLRARVVAGLEARLSFPSYLRRSSDVLADPVRITAPRGTTVELRIRPSIDARRGRVLIGAQEVRLRAQDGVLTGRFVVRESAGLAIRLLEGTQWYEDRQARSLNALPDDRPEIELISPPTGAWVQADTPQPVQFRAGDDAGLAEVHAVVRLPGGTERRHRVWTSLRAGATPTELDEVITLLPAALGVRAGDQFELWLEATDGDVVTGPNVGRSATVVLEAASEAQHLSQHIPRLHDILGATLDVLGDRLEQPIPEATAGAQTRFASLRGKTETVVAGLDSLVKALGEGSDVPSGLDPDDLGGAKRRLERLLRREGRLYGGRKAALSQRARVDGRAVRELETDALLFEDMLSVAHVDEAAALAQELERLRTRIGELLSELKASDSEEARRALMAEVARAERRLRDLMRSLAKMATQVPTEFVNQEAMAAEQPESSLTDLRGAVQSGDLDAAAKHLQDLQDQLSRLTDSLREGGLRMQQQRQGPRNEAMAKAQEQLSMLADEQGRLAQRSAQRMRDAFERTRGQSGQGGAGEALRREADALQEQLEALSGDGVGGTRRQALDQAMQRARDTRDLLDSGDLSEARSMAGATARSMRQVADGMEMEARMFQGHDGRAGERAENARKASELAQGLEQGIDRQMPKQADQMTPQQQAQMRADARAQSELRKQTQKLREAMTQGPGGLPLSPDASRDLQQAEQQMGEAQRRLQQGKGREATGQQQAATDQLQRAAQQLRQKQEGKGKGKGGGSGQQRASGDSGETGDGEGTTDEVVRIPDSDDFRAPQAMRRRLLDAMRQPSPAGYERAVDRYYRELLR